MLEDNKVNLLFGLDNLKRHQCCIDLVEWRLHFNKYEFSVPFLGDGDIKESFGRTLSRQESLQSQGSGLDPEKVK